MRTLEQRAKEYRYEYEESAEGILRTNILRLERSYNLLNRAIEADLYNESLKIAALNIAQQIDLNKQILEELTKNK